MNRIGGDYTSGLQRVRTELVTRLRDRSSEIEEAILDRIRALAAPDEHEDPDYNAGLRATVADAVEYAFAVIEQGEDWLEQIPSSATAQARRAARNGVSLATVLRRYAAGDRLLGEFIMSEADRFPTHALRKVLRAQGSRVDRLMADVSAEYAAELNRMRRSPAQRLAELVKRLLSGDGSIESRDLEYELDACHLGAILTGSSAHEAMRAIASDLSCQLLFVPRGNGIVWAWLGSRRRITATDVERCLPLDQFADVSMAIGEPGWGIDGWRLTHREAQAAFEVALRKPQRLTRGSEVILLAAVLRDEAMARSLRETYLAPLDDGGDAGRALRQTLRAYFDAGLNAATAAAAIGVDRHTVQRRLRKVEDSLGCLLPVCHAQLEVALSLGELDEYSGVEPVAGRPLDVVQRGG